MTYTQLYRQCRKSLSNPSADFDLSQLFKGQFGEAALIHNGETEVSPDEAFIFQHKIRRLADGYPLQYLLGEWEFYSVSLKVGEGVLIPRPDTETLIDTALMLAKGIEAPVIADLGAGSGAISLALAANIPDAFVWAVEISEQALPFLYQNISQSGFSNQITVVQADMLKPLDLPALDLIVSNPPYLTKAEMDEIPKQVSFEPAMALDGGEDGLDFYRVIIEAAPGLLKPEGKLILEAGWRQSADIIALLERSGYTGIGVQKDLAGIDRSIYATANQ